MRNGNYSHVTLCGGISVEETDEIDVRAFRAAIARTNKQVPALPDMDEHDMERYLEDQAFGTEVA